jgi:predicted NUDIX family NTP pyrophosphohydrolase
VKLFCQNAQILEITRMRSPVEELDQPDYDDFMNEFYDDESLAPWFVVAKAVEQFRDKLGRYPGE